MMRKTLIAAALAATAITAVAPTAAMARDGWGYRDGGWRQDRGWRGDGWRHGRWQGDRAYYGGGYGGYYGPRHYYYGRHCDRGDGGTIIGAIAGGLLGNSIAGYGDRTAGTIIGAGAGALAGGAIDRTCRSIP
jgi:hypothetical protein